MKDLQYQPINTLIVCSNTLIGGGHIFKVGDITPLVIGKGNTPRIWLRTRIQSRWVSLVEANVPKYDSLVINTEKDNSTTVFFRDKLLLRSLMINNNTCEVTELDLRPIGLNIFGDKNVLHFGNNKFGNNTASGNATATMFALEDNSNTDVVSPWAFE